MPLPTDEKLLSLSEDLLRQFETLFGSYPGIRPAHAKGILLSGTFTPAPGAHALTRAPHITRESTPVTVRFSNSTGVPLLPDNDPNADPRGIAIRFHLAERVHTDIVGHSVDGFPTHTGEEFLELLRAIAGATPIEQFLGSHPAALAFVQTPKPAPSSFAHEAYFGVTAMHFTNAAGTARYGRYRIVPEAGVEHLDPETVKSKGANYLFEEIAQRVAAEPVGFQILVQVAADRDVVDDATIHWPSDRQQVPFGRIVLSEVVADQPAEQKKIIFDPIPRVDGIDPSADPLLELRAAVYLMSGRRRRQAT
jgi:catalase